MILIASLLVLLILSVLFTNEMRNIVQAVLILIGVAVPVAMALYVSPMSLWLLPLVGVAATLFYCDR